MDKNNKKAIITVIWLVLLGGLMFGITHFNGAGGSGAGGTTPPAPSEPPPPPPDVLAKRWPEIVAHAVAPPRGPANAPYTMAEFGDFQCPPCGKTRPRLEKLLAQSPTSVNLLFVQLPLPNPHPWATSAAEAAEVAASQGRFWPMYDVLYSHQDDLEPGFYGDYAAQAGLERARFQAAFNSHRFRQKVEESMKFAADLHVLTTPTVLVRNNATGVVTVVPYHDLVRQTSPNSNVFVDGPFVQHPLWAASAGKG